MSDPSRPKPPNYLFSMVNHPGLSEISIHLDGGGIEYLISILQELNSKAKAGISEHEHLFTPNGGGWQLSESMLKTERTQECTQVDSLTIYGWSSDWKLKHNL